MKKFVLALLILSCQLAAQNEIKLSYAKNSTAVIPVYSGDQDFISIKDIVELTDAGFYENTAKKKVVITVSNRQIKVTGNNPFIVIDEKQVFQIPVESQFIDGIIFVPLQFFIPIFNAISSTPILVNDQKPSLTASTPAVITTVKPEENDSNTVNLTAMDFDKKSNGLLMKIKTGKEFRNDDVEVWRNKNWLYVTVSGARYSDNTANEIKRAEQFKLIKSALIFQHSNSVQFSFQLNYEIPGQEITVDEKTGDIYVSVRVSDPAQLDLVGQKQANLNIQKDQWKIDKICLDAGHGGKDHGAKGKNGTKEKDVTLGIVLKLGKLIEKRLGLKVEYTRTGDTYPTLHGRTKFANSVNAKLFVSVHCNANVKRTANGFETFFLSPSRTDEALAVARLENEVIDLEEDKHKYGDFTDEKFILSNIMQSVFVKESEELAASIQEGIDKKVELENRGVAQAPFYVLMGASMPSVLVETAFISNVKEEKFLKSEDGQTKLAEGIFEGIKNFIRNYEQSMREMK